MPQIGRNDPCPCGSGKKYKRCCLLVREADERQARTMGAGLGQALDWLFKTHGPAVQVAIEQDFFEAASRDEIRDLFAGVSSDLRVMLEVNLNDWLLADAEIEVGGARRRTAELLAEAGGPPLDAAARQRIDEMARRPLALYEVEESRPDGMWVRDLLAPAAPRFWVSEPATAESPRPGTPFGGRLLEEGDGRILSGALYPLPASLLAQLKDHLRAGLHGRRGEDPALVSRRVLGPAIIAAWLDCLAVSLAPPELEDYATGEPILLVTDRYRVNDWERLSAALAGEGEVEGDRAEGWVRGAERNGKPDVLLSLRPGAEDRLEAFARTAARGDEGRSWLLRVAGDAVAFERRDTEDPRDAWRPPSVQPARTL